MAKEKEYSKLKVVLENGGVINLKCESEVWESDVFESFLDCVETGKFFNEDGWCDLEMSYKGEKITILDCKKVVGWDY